MNPTVSNVLKYSPLAIGISILAVGAFFVPWSDVLPYFARLSTESYIAILTLGIAHYVTRIVRYYYMLRVLKTPRTFFQTVQAYFIAQPVSLLPAGETYRVATLKEYANVPASQGVPIVVIQSFTENISLVALALIGAVFLNQHALIVMGLVMVYAVVFLFLGSRRAADKGHRAINKLPFVNVARHKYFSFINKNRILLSGKSLAVLIVSGFASSLFAIILLFIIGNDLDINLSFTDATIGFVFPTVLQNVTFLPGGIGVNEQGSVGILVLLGASTPAAVALTLIMRFVTLILGVILGLLSMMIAAMSDKD